VSYLVLTRKEGESITIHTEDQLGEDIVIHLRNISHGQVKIAINAPKTINIRRSELPIIQDND